MYLTRQAIFYSVKFTISVFFVDGHLRSFNTLIIDRLAVDHSCENFIHM